MYAGQFQQIIERRLLVVTTVTNRLKTKEDHCKF